MKQHNITYKSGLFLFVILVLTLFIWKTPDAELIYSDQKGYLNLHDSVKYVGMHICKECHFDIYKTYLRTGMGMSFDTANKDKSAAVIGPDSILFDPYRNLHYKPSWDFDTLRIEEYRLNGGDKLHSRGEKVNYIIGSGQHTNSHIFLSGQYAYQAPFTFYTQDSLFDFPPGFKDGHNSRFSRKIGLECMSCHNGFPDFVLGSENKYSYIPDGIDCERCHGPGEVHVNFKKSGFIIDTAIYIDYSIVNPAKLNPKLQIDICARCHLQGTMILKPGKSFFDFKPGMLLTEVMDIFMPLFVGGKEDFIMASHLERLVQSTCYIESGGQFSCSNCHNPHISRLETNREIYNKFCLDCHDAGRDYCSVPKNDMILKNNDCVLCHMRESGSRDIPHVKIHDHKISKPPTEEQLNEDKVFKGMVSINNPDTDSLTIARGYLLEYESYHPDANYLDSAASYLNLLSIPDSNYYFNAVINLYFLKKDYRNIISLVEQKGVKETLESQLTIKDYSNYDAWTSYRIGQSYESMDNNLIANYFYENAIELAKYNLEFQNKYGSLLVKTGKFNEAKQTFEFIISEDPDYTSAYVNLGFVWMNLKDIDGAKECFETAINLDPDHIQGLVNLAGLYMLEMNNVKAKEMLDRVFDIDPENAMARNILAQLR